MQVILGSPPALEVYDVPESYDLELFRIVRVSDPEDPGLHESFMSNFQTGRPPRGAEFRSAAIQMGLSMYEERTQAEQTARMFPVIGRYIAHVVLAPGRGFNLASTGQAGHWTVWGRPEQFVAGVADIYPW